MNLWYGYRDELPDDAVGGHRGADALVQVLVHRAARPRAWSTTSTTGRRTTGSSSTRSSTSPARPSPTTTFTQRRPHRRRAPRRGPGAGSSTWLDEKARFGFTEWHSDVYYQKDVTPLLTLVEWADDRGGRARGRRWCSTCVLFDVALPPPAGQLRRHPRPLLHEGQERGRRPGHVRPGQAPLRRHRPALPVAGDAGADAVRPGPALPAARGHPPDRPSRSRRPSTASAWACRSTRRPRSTPDPEAPYGYAFDDPDERRRSGGSAARRPRGRSCRSPSTPSTSYDLWDSRLLRAVRAAARPRRRRPRRRPRRCAQSLAPMLGFGLLTEVNTYTYRSPDVMLSTAQDYRPGHVLASSTTPGRRPSTSTPSSSPPTRRTSPRSGTEWPDADGYWTGTGSMPRSAQHGRGGHPPLRTRSSPPGPAAPRAFGYLRLHPRLLPAGALRRGRAATGGWTFGRKGDGYVALWSWRPAEWRDAPAGGVHPRADRAVRPRGRGWRRQRVDRRGRARGRRRHLRRVPRRAHRRHGVGHAARSPTRSGTASSSRPRRRARSSTRSPRAHRVRSPSTGSASASATTAASTRRGHGCRSGRATTWWSTTAPGSSSTSPTGLAP